MKYNLKNCRDGSPATYPTTVEIGERDGILTFTFEAGHSGYYCPYPGYNGAHSSGDAVEILIGSDPERKRYYEIELSPRGDQMLARIEYKGEKNEAPVIEVYPVETSFLTTSVTRQNDGYKGVISFSKQDILTGEGEIFFNAYRLDTDGGAETDRHLFALVPTLRPKFHTPRFFARLSDFVKEN